MATKFYFIQDLPNYIPPSWHGGWDQIGDAPGLDGDPGIHQSIDPDKYGISNGTMYGFASAIPSTPFRKGIVQFVSRPVLPQTISGTVDVIYGVREVNAAHNLYARWHMYIINCTTHAVHGTLLNQYEEAPGTGGTEWASTSSYPGRSLQALQTLTSVTVPDDGAEYRLVVECGYASHASVGTSVDGRIAIGARSGYQGALLPDLTVGSTPATTKAGYIEFSGTVALAAHPIPNIGPETASVIPSLPFTVTLDPLKAGGTWGRDYLNGGGYWYRHTVAAAGVMDMLCTNADPLDANWRMLHEITPGSGPPLQEDVANTLKKTQMWAVRAGDVSYFRIYMDSYSPGSTVTFSITWAPAATVLAGDLLILTDDAGVNAYDNTLIGAYPAVWYEPTTGATRLVSARWPSSELGVTLANGKWGCAGNGFAPQLLTFYIFDRVPDCAELSRTVLANRIRSVGTDFTSFYVAVSPPDTSVVAASPAIVYKLDDAGAIGASYGPLAVTSIGMLAEGSRASMGVSRNGAILYYGHTVSGGIVKRHDLLSNVALPDFVSPPSGGTYTPGDIIVLHDNTVVVVWNGVVMGISEKVIHYATDGTVLRTIDYGSTYTRVHHIVHDAEDSGTAIWIWTQHSESALHDGSLTGKSYFHLVHLAGSTDVSWAHYFSSNGEGPRDPNPSGSNPERFTAANCCPLLVMRGLTDGNGGGGEPGTRLRVRRVRRAPHLSAEQAWQFFTKFQLDFEPGIGTSSVPSPQITLRWSDDGGHSWHTPLTVSAGLAGQYTRRAIWRRLGRGRDRVFEIYVEDPVRWALVAAYLDAQKGTS